jgi:hypothetical protein
MGFLLLSRIERLNSGKIEHSDTSRHAFVGYTERWLLQGTTFFMQRLLTEEQLLTFIYSRVSRTHLIDVIFGLISTRETQNCGFLIRAHRV